MNAKTAISRIIGKGGLKSGNCRADNGLEKGKQESSAPRKSMEEAGTGKGKVTDPESSGVLQVSRALPSQRGPCPADPALGLGSSSHSFPSKTFDVTTGLVVLDSLDKLLVSHFHSQIFFNDR